MDDQRRLLEAIASGVVEQLTDASQVDNRGVSLTLGTLCVASGVALLLLGIALDDAGQLLLGQLAILASLGQQVLIEIGPSRGNQPLVTGVADGALDLALAIAGVLEFLLGLTLNALDALAIAPRSGSSPCHGRRSSLRAPDGCGRH